MLRIFGFYSFKKGGEEIIPKMLTLFDIKSRFTKFLHFHQNNIFIDYETTKTKESKRFYFIDRKKQIACFIKGNIFAYEKNQLDILSDKHIAKMVIAEYKKGGLGFVKYFRGEFNIIIVDREQLFLINDRMGLSTMYTYRIKEGFLFCSQAEPIIWLKKDNHIDYGSVAEFLVYGFVPDGKTFIRRLTNQKPGTILKYVRQKAIVKKYAPFRALDLKDAGSGEVVKAVKNIFNESVRIRVNRGPAFLELSGGWDTRFVLANLLELHKKVVAFTVKRNKDDLVIAKKITKQKRLTHIILKESIIPAALKEDHIFKFKPMKTIYDLYHKANIFNKKYKDLIAFRFFAAPRFTGLFGTELLGYVPEWFTKSWRLDFNAFAVRIFTHNFLSRLYAGKGRKSFSSHGNQSGSNNLIYSFLNQVGRSYFNAHYTGSWERPTKFFSYLYLNPFADSKFVALLCSLDYDRHMPYRLYQEVYKTYYPDFLDIPWTSIVYRIQKNLKKDAQQEKNARYEERQELLKLIPRDNNFRSFLKGNGIVQKTKLVISGRLKELYFLFKWFEAYKSVLPASEVKFFLE